LLGFFFLGCATLDGGLLADLGGTELPATVKVNINNCSVGQTDVFNTVEYTNISPPECKVVASEQRIVDGGSLEVLFSFDDDPDCRERTVIGASVAAGGAVLGATAVALLIYFRRKKLDRKDKQRIDAIGVSEIIALQKYSRSYYYLLLILILILILTTTTLHAG